jgi:hypothetical protein
MILAALDVASVHAAPASHRTAASQPDLVGDFRALAQQRPRECPPSASAESAPVWPGGTTECAWQNRLRKQSWSWSYAGAPGCISRQARWWTQAQAGVPPAAARSVWDRRWTVQTLHIGSGDERRLLVLERDRKDQWLATEWRWTPNPRPATRRWQEARWELLLESAARHQGKSAAADTPDAARMQPVFRRVLGRRPGELGQDGLTLEAAGLCLHASNPLPGQTTLALSYSANDSRLEQRAAMHLQLSRLHPNAKWLTQFRMLAMPANRPGGAKFLATWIEGGQLKSQLWMPAKGDAATVRVLVSAALPRGRDELEAALPKAKQIVERETEAIALDWAATHE